MRATITPAGEQRVSRSQIRTETRRRDQVFVTDSLASTSDRRLAERPFGSCTDAPLERSGPKQKTLPWASAPELTPGGGYAPPELARPGPALNVRLSGRQVRPKTTV